jgi:hypothetical protein
MAQFGTGSAGLLALALGVACNGAADTTLLVEIGGGPALASGEKGSPDDSADASRTAPDTFDAGGALDAGGEPEPTIEPSGASTTDAGDASLDPGWVYPACSYMPPVDVGDLYGLWSGPNYVIDDFERELADSCDVAGRRGHWSNADSSLALSFGPGVSSTSRRSLLLVQGLALSFPRAGEAFSALDASIHEALRFYLHNPGTAPAAVNLVVAVAGSDGCNGVAPLPECLDRFTTTVYAEPGTSEHRVDWNEFRFTGPALQPASPEPGTIRHLYEIQFNGSGVYLDDLACLGSSCGDGVCSSFDRCMADCCGDGRCDFSEYSPGPPANTTLGDRWGASLTFCALDCPPLLGGCPTADLGSQVPVRVSGNTALMTDEFAGSCGIYVSDSPPRPAAPGYGTADAEYTFTAPEDGTYVFDVGGLSGANVYVLDGACFGSELACVTEAGPTFQPAAASVVLRAGQTVTAIVDSSYGDHGYFELEVSKQDVSGRAGVF